MALLRPERHLPDPLRPRTALCGALGYDDGTHDTSGVRPLCSACETIAKFSTK